MVFLLPIGTVLLAAFAQRAIQISPNKVTPKLRKISPMSGLKNKFGAVGLVEFLKSSAKLVIVMVVLSLLFARDFFQLGNLSTLPVQTAVLFTLKKVLELTLYVLLALIAIGITDFIWQNFNHIKKNMMTRKEVEDEHKEAEGDPHLKGRRRQRAQQIALSQVISSVPEADVIIVNPTHYAVALKWDALSGRPPFCVTKGTDEIALKIRQTANDCGVPIYRSPSLARSIFASVEIGQHIQPNNYRAVAAAIRFAQRMRRR